MITWNEIRPVTCTRLIYANPLTCSVCTWSGTREPVPQRDLISSSWAVDPCSRQTCTAASQAYGKEDKQPPIHSCGCGGIKGDCFFLQKVKFLFGKSSFAVWSPDNNIKLKSTKQQTHKLLTCDTCTAYTALTFHSTLVQTKKKPF